MVPIWAGAMQASQPHHGLGKETVLQGPQRLCRTTDSCCWGLSANRLQPSRLAVADISPSMSVCVSLAEP